MTDRLSYFSQSLVLSRWAISGPTVFIITILSVPGINENFYHSGELFFFLPGAQAHRENVP